MDEIVIKDLATATIDGKQYLILGSPDGVGIAYKAELTEVGNFLNLSGAATTFQGNITPTSPAPTLDGVYLATTPGTYTNYGGIVVNANNGGSPAKPILTFIGVGADQTTFAKQENVLDYEVPGAPSATITEGDTNPVQVGAVFEANEAIKSNIEGINAQIVRGRLEIIDGDGNLGARLNTDGTWEFGDVTVRQLSASALNIASLAINEIIAKNIFSNVFQSDGDKIMITDSNDNIGYIFDPKEIKLAEGLSTQVVHSTTYGQSLTIFTVSGAVVTTSTESGVYTFTLGPIMRPFDGDPTTYNDLRLSFQVQYESPCGGLARMLKKAYIDEDGYDLSAAGNNQKILISAGGQPILNLSKGTENYNRFIEGVTNGKTLANEEGSNYSHPFVYWKQGEDDWLTNNEIYKLRLKKLREDLDADIKAIEPNNPDLFFICYQLATADLGGLNRSHIGIATMDLCRESPYFFAGPPMYPMTHPDNVHLNPISSVESGAIAGYIAKKVLSGYDWKGTRVENFEFFDNTIILNYNVESLPLVFDTTRVTNPGNYGYNLFTSAGVAKTITNVEILRGEVVKITSNVPIVAGDILRYA